MWCCRRINTADWPNYLGLGSIEEGNGDTMADNSTRSLSIGFTVEYYMTGTLWHDVALYVEQLPICNYYSRA